MLKNPQNHYFINIFNALLVFKNGILFLYVAYVSASLIWKWSLIVECEISFSRVFFSLLSRVLKTKTGQEIGNYFSHNLTFPQEIKKTQHNFFFPYYHTSLLIAFIMTLYLKVQPNYKILHLSSKLPKLPYRYEKQ